MASEREKKRDHFKEIHLVNSPVCRTKRKISMGILIGKRRMGTGNIGTH